MTFCWYFAREDIEHKTPSREDGMPLATELQYRRDGARFIINASNTLGLRYDTVATGVVFFHRFFMLQSFKQFDRWVVAAACLLLAGKVEETPKKCKDILKVTNSLLNSQQMAQFGSNPKEELLTHERILLQTIKFDLQLEHPYSYLLKFAKGLRGDKGKIEKLVQMAWTFVNDSLCTTLCLQWEPQAIAVAFIYLAGKLTKYDLQSATHSRSKSWWRQFVDTLDIHDLEAICHQVLDIYGESEKKSETEAEKPPTTEQPSQQTPVTTAIPKLMQQPPPPVPAPPPAPPTQLMTSGRAATPPTTTVPQQQPSVTQQPSSSIQTHSSFLNPAGGGGGMTSFGFANPLQVLQNILPGTQHPATQPTPLPGITQFQPLAYSTLNVSVASTPPTRPTLPPAGYHMPGMPTLPSGAMVPNKILLPGTSTTSAMSQYQYQQQAAVAGFQQSGQTRLAPLLGTAGTTPQVMIGQTGHLSQNLLLPPAKRPALDPPYRVAQSPVLSTPPRPSLTQPNRIPATTLLSPQVPITQGGATSLSLPQLAPTIPTTQPRTQTPLGGGVGLHSMTSQLPGQQHHGYNPVGGTGWGR